MLPARVATLASGPSRPMRRCGHSSPISEEAIRPIGAIDRPIGCSSSSWGTGGQPDRGAGQQGVAVPTNVIGFGTAFLGQRSYGQDGSYVTTEFVTALYFPVVPLRSFRVTETGMTMRWWGPRAAHSTTTYRVRREPLCWAQVGAVYGAVILSVASFELFLLGLGDRQSPGPTYWLYSHMVIAEPLLLLSATWPMIVGLILRGRARRRARMARSASSLS